MNTPLEVLKEAVYRSRLKQKEAAALIGVSNTRFSNVMTGRESLSLKVLHEWVSKLGYTVQMRFELFESRNENGPS